MAVKKAKKEAVAVAAAAGAGVEATTSVDAGGADAVRAGGRTPGTSSVARGGSSGDSFQMKLGRPKPPPPPKPTPPELRMALLSELLTNMCETFEKLARLERDEHDLVHDVQYRIPQRLAAIAKEFEEIQQVREERERSVASGKVRNELDITSEILRERELNGMAHTHKRSHLLSPSLPLSLSPFHADLIYSPACMCVRARVRAAKCRGAGAAESEIGEEQAHCRRAVGAVRERA
jgi:hypothetical protein